METVTVDMDSLREILSKETETLLEMDNVGVSATFYWDAHGKKIPWNLNGKKSFNRYFKHIKLTSVKKKIKWKYIDNIMEEEYWYMDADGERLDLGEITSYKVADNCIRLKCCVGAG